MADAMKETLLTGDGAAIVLCEPAKPISSQCLQKPDGAASVLCEPAKPISSQCLQKPDGAASVLCEPAKPISSQCLRKPGAEDDDADDVVLKKKLRIGKRLAKETSEELCLNPAENPPNTVLQHKPSEQLQDLYIPIWSPQYHRGLVGHAALLGDNFYMSWFPDTSNILKKIIKKPPGKAKESFKDDLKGGQVPSKIFKFRTYNMATLVEHWNIAKNSPYKLLSNNCCNAVYDALRVAGAPESISNHKLWKPVNLIRYCEENFEPIDFDEFSRCYPTLFSDMISVPNDDPDKISKCTE